VKASKLAGRDRRSGGSRRLITRRQLLVLALLILIGAGISYLLGGARPLGRPVGNSAVAARALADRVSPQTTQGAGDLTVVVFTDYQCSACRAAEPALSRAVASDGNVRVIYREWPIFGERSERAARIALAAHRQGRYLAVHRALMRVRAFDDGAVRTAAESAGADWSQLESDLARHGPAIAVALASASQDAAGLGLRGTPSYLIGPLLVEGALAEGSFRRAFAEARGAKHGPVFTGP
jgi:protein-disulfide isomerase